MYQDFTATPIFNKCAIRYQAYDRYAPIDIPLHLTSYKAPTRNPKTTTIASIPQVDIGSNSAVKGISVGLGSNELLKIHLEGFMQTPMLKLGGATPWEQPLLTLFDTSGASYYATYADVISMYWEGRGSNAYGVWARVDPLWFRDPYGRVFPNPRIIDFTASYVSNVPGRNTFTMSLQI